MRLFVQLDESKLMDSFYLPFGQTIPKEKQDLLVTNLITLQSRVSSLLDILNEWAVSDLGKYYYQYYYCGCVEA